MNEEKLELAEETGAVVDAETVSFLTGEFLVFTAALELRTSAGQTEGKGEK